MDRLWNGRRLYSFPINVVKANLSRSSRHCSWTEISASFRQTSAWKWLRIVSLPDWQTYWGRRGRVIFTRWANKCMPRWCNLMIMTKCACSPKPMTQSCMEILRIAYKTNSSPRKRLMRVAWRLMKSRHLISTSSLKATRQMCLLSGYRTFTRLATIYSNKIYSEPSTSLATKYKFHGAISMFIFCASKPRVSTRVRQVAR